MKRFIVKGTQTPFPIDMLRFDECWPATVQDSDKIKNSFGFRHGRRVRWQIQLVSKRNNVPTEERWNSYAVEVVGEERIPERPERPDPNPPGGPNAAED